MRLASIAHAPTKGMAREEPLMKRKTVIKILIDLAMLVIYLQLMFCYDLNTLYHEVMGIAIGTLFIAHVALNTKSIIGLLRKLPQGKLSPVKTVLVIADCLLPLGMIVIIVSGILIARNLFIGPGSLEVVTIHNIASYICLTILVLHTALHARYLCPAPVFSTNLNVSPYAATVCIAGGL